MKKLGAIMAFTALTGCVFPPGAFDPPSRNASLIDGPPIEDVVTSFDKALSCLRGKVQPNIIFAVGQVVDATGKDTYADGGTGKFVSQGAGEMVQSALFKAGVSVVNRRDPNISITEANWGIRDIKRQMPVNFYVSGSINSLDFIPGGGYSIQIAGMGPKARQSRILVALDLTMTDAFTGRVVANIPLQKQIYTREFGNSLNSFFGSTLVQMDAGGMEREAMHFALRQMVSLATLELLGQLMNQDTYEVCRAKVESRAGQITSNGTADRVALSESIKVMKDQVTPEPLPLEVPVSEPEPKSMVMEASAPAMPSAPLPLVTTTPQPGDAAQQPAPPTEAVAKGRKATSTATQAIRVAQESLAAPTRKAAIIKAAEALQLSNLALNLLREAAQLGFSGDEGEIAAVVIQQALKAAQEASTAAAERKPDPQTDTSVTPPATTAPPSDEADATGTKPVVTDPLPTTPKPVVAPVPGGAVQDQQQTGGQGSSTSVHLPSSKS